MANNMWRVAIGAGLAVLAGAGAVLAQSHWGRQLTAAEIQAAYVGNTLEGVSSRGEEFVSYFDPSGQMRMRSGQVSDEGKYRIEADGRVCSRWSRIRQGAESCGTVFFDGTNYRGILNGGVSSTFTIKPGNGKGL